MDKNTLSQYGWVVIVIIILIILIALATPFGGYIKASVKEMTIGLNDKIVDVANNEGVDIGSPVFNDNEYFDTSPTNYTPEEIAADDHIVAIGKNNVNYVIAKFNDNFTTMVVLKNGADSDGVWVGARHTIHKNLREQYGDSIRTIIVGDGITDIPLLGLAHFKRADRIILPNTIETIQGQAFLNDQRLREINLPVGLKSIGKDAFNMAGITEIVLPEGLETIGSDAFYGSKLEYITVPGSVKNINCFTNCQYLRSVVLNEGCETIGQEAFIITPMLKEITIPISVTSIEYSKFPSDALEIVKCPAGSYAESWAHASGLTVVNI